MGVGIELAERGLVPDAVVRVGIRRLLLERLDKERGRVNERDRFVAAMKSSPLAVSTGDANDQHYEVPTGYFTAMLGPRLKYSCALFEDDTVSLPEAETAMLALTTARAGLADGQDILELGCGWGSLTLFMAARFPNSRITAVSNSHSQRQHIEKVAAASGLANITVITCDMNDFATDQSFDRVVSVEMFEHMRNHALLFQRIASWLKPDGRLFFHVFCHRSLPYFFEDEGESDWMSRHFFTGGLMPSYDLPMSFQDDLVLEDRWRVNGTHYARTCRAWLDNLSANREVALEALAGSGNPEDPRRQLNRWRLFTMACEELFAHDGGNEWHVGHFVMKPRQA